MTTLLTFFLYLLIMISFANFILSIYPFGSHNKYAFIHNTIAFSETYSLESNRSDDRLLKQQVLSSY